MGGGRQLSMATATATATKIAVMVMTGMESGLGAGKSCTDRQLVRTSMPFCFIASIAFFETSLWNAGSSLSADWMIVTFGGVRSAFLYSAWPCSSLSAR